MQLDLGIVAHVSKQHQLHPDLLSKSLDQGKAHLVFQIKLLYCLLLYQELQQQVDVFLPAALPNVAYRYIHYPKLTKKKVVDYLYKNRVHYGYLKKVKNN